MNRSALLASVAPRAFETNSMKTTPEAVQAAKRFAEANSGNAGDPMMVRSSDSSAMLEYWDLTDAIVDGIAALRNAGPVYLPKFSDEEDPDYQYRLKCTKLTNIYRDTVEGLAAKPFEKEVELVVDEDKKVPENIETFAEDVDGSGNNLTIFAGATFFNGINSAIDWIFIDYAKPDPTIRTVADAKQAGVRPYWTHVLGRNVFEARSKVINGIETLTYLRLFEPGKPDHIRIFERADNGVVTWELFEKRDAARDYGDGRQTHFHSIDNGVVSIGVIPMVPFITGRRDGRSWRFFPAMRDAADLQIELYQQESALKWNKQLGAYSMLSGNGVAPDKGPDGKPKKIATGPGRVLYAPPNGDGKSGSWAFVQPDASVMKFLAEDVKETISQLRELGRQPLTAQSGNLTVITTAVAAGKAKSAVSAWALMLKDALENAMVITCKWMGITSDQYDPTVGVYTEFDEFLDGKDLESLDADRDRGDISRQTLLEEKKRRGVYGPEFDIEEEEKRLLKELPGDGEDTLDINGNPIDPVTGKPAPVDPNAPPQPAPAKKPPPAKRKPPVK